MHKIETTQRKSRRLRWFGLFGGILVLLAAGGIFLSQYTPRAYQPQPVDNPQEVSTYLTHKLGPDFINQVQLDEPFELLVEQSGLNDIIRRQDWIEDFEGFSFHDPLVLFDTGTIYLMGTLHYKGISSVVTVIALPEMMDDGKVWLNIRSIRLGVIPVTGLVSVLAKKGFVESRDCFTGEPELEEVVRAIIYNEPFEPIFKMEDRLVRVSDFTLLPQQLTIRFTPE